MKVSKDGTLPTGRISRETVRDVPDRLELNLAIVIPSDRPSLWWSNEWSSRRFDTALNGMVVVFREGTPGTDKVPDTVLVNRVIGGKTKGVQFVIRKGILHIVALFFGTIVLGRVFVKLFLDQRSNDGATKDVVIGELVGGRAGQVFLGHFHQLFLAELAVQL